MSSSTLLHCVLTSPGEVRLYIVYDCYCTCSRLICVIIRLSVISGRYVGFRRETFWNNPERPTLKKVSGLTS